MINLYQDAVFCVSVINVTHKTMEAVHTVAVTLATITVTTISVTLEK